MKDPSINIQLKPALNWVAIDTVLLDMDGTLVDKHFDDYFWEQFVPESYGTLHDLHFDEARENLLTRYRQVEDTLLWTDLDYWSKELGMDIPAMKWELKHMIQVHPFVHEFLSFLRQQDKEIFLVTAAHHKTLDIKIKTTGLGSRFDQLICAEEVGTAKEDPRFWLLLEELLGYNRNRTLLADDTLKVLRAAEQSGIKELIHIAKPSSQKPAQYAPDFHSISGFDELMT